MRLTLYRIIALESKFTKLQVEEWLPSGRVSPSTLRWACSAMVIPIKEAQRDTMFVLTKPSCPILRHCFQFTIIGAVCRKKINKDKNTKLRRPWIGPCLVML